MQRTLTILLELVAILSTTPSPAAEQPVSIPVSFEVVNTNTSKLPCDTDGKEYTIHGDLVGLPSRLAGADAVTVYLHGSTLSRIQWRMPVPGYDYAWEMAKLGHVSLAIDQLGFDESGHPDGNLVCTGGNADIAHQIIGMLRSGVYSAGGEQAGPAFSTVVIAGNSSGGITAEIEAYSYGDVDGLILFGAGDVAVSVVPLVVTRMQGFILTCSEGGEPAEDGWTEPTGYAYTWPSAEAELEDVAHKVDPAVADAFKAARNRDPCAYQNTVASGLVNNNFYSWQIDVPVLLMYGEHEKLFGPQPVAGEIQRAKMIGSDDITLVINQDEGHVGMFEIHADVFRAGVSAWLTPRGF